MAEEKSKRTVAEIQQEYGNLCTRAGHVQYQLDAHTKDLQMINQLLRDLNFEAAAAQADEKQAAQEPQKEEQK